MRVPAIYITELVIADDMENIIDYRHWQPYNSEFNEYSIEFGVKMESMFKH